MKQPIVVLRGEVLVNANGFPFFSVSFPKGTPQKKARYDSTRGKWTGACATSEGASKKAWKRMLRTFDVPKPGTKGKVKITIERVHDPRYSV